MKKYYTLFLVFNAVPGYDFWIVDFVEKNSNEFLVSVIVTTVQDVGMFATLPQSPILSNITIQESTLSEAEAKIFFKRIDYFLGIDNV